MARVEDFVIGDKDYVEEVVRNRMGLNVNIASSA